MVGIVASRLKDRFHRPAIVFARGAGDGELQGLRPLDRRASTCATRSTSWPSARPGLIARFGGHAFAAGLTIDEAALPAFAAAFEAGRARAADARATRTDPRNRRRPWAGRADARARRGVARTGLGPGDAGARLRRHVRRHRHAGRRRQAHAADARARPASASRRSCSSTRSPCPRRIRAAFRPESQRMAGHRVAAADDRALAAGLIRAVSGDRALLAACARSTAISTAVRGAPGTVECINIKPLFYIQLIDVSEH